MRSFQFESSEREPAQRGRAGFTLIELLIVILILGGMMVWVLGSFGAANVTTEIEETKITLRVLGDRAQAYANQRKFSDFPADDFSDPSGKVRIVPDSINAGIESLIGFLAREDSMDTDLTQLEGSFGNTDGDKSDAPIGRLDRPDKLEVLDKWGNPVVYIHNRSYKKGPFTYRDSTGADVEVQPWKRSDGSYYNPRTFQLFSAGPNGIYGDDDDVAVDFQPGS